MFQVLFNNSISGIAYHRIVYDIKGNPIDYVITDVNPQYEKILPFKREDVINKRATEVYHVESAPHIDIYSRVASTQVSTSFEAEFPPLEKYFKISVISPKKGEFITVFDDLSEQKRAEDVVKVERDKLQAMMDGLTSAEIGIDIVDINYNILFQNQFLKDRFGDISTEYCYKKYMGLSQPCEFCPMEMAIKNNAVETTEIIGNDGRGYQLISAPLPNPDRTIDKVIEVVLDITNRKRAEQKLKANNIELSVLNRIITIGNESTNLKEFLEKSYDQVLDIVGFDRGGVYLYNPETQHNLLVHHKNVHNDFIAAVKDVDISVGLFSTIFDKNNPFYIEDFSEFIENSKELGVYSAAIIPLRSKDKYVGSLNIGSHFHQILSENE